MRKDVDASYVVCDVTKLNQVEALADVAWERLGHVDMMFNNAGVGIGQTPILDTSIEDLRRVMEVNFFGVWNGCRVFGKRFLEQGKPAGIYNTGSENSPLMLSRTTLPILPASMLCLA